MRKIAIFNQSDQMALLGACQSDHEYIPIWLMMRCGMHPSDVSRAKDNITFSGDFMEYRRAKNQKPMRIMIPKDLKPRLEKWLKSGRKISREGYFHLVRRVGIRINHPECTPMSLRHTFCIEELRRYMKMLRPPPDYMFLLAKRMGCGVEIVRQNYIDLEQWEGIGEESDGKEPS